MSTTTTYPNAPGFKEKGGTSEAAAGMARGSAETDRARLLTAFRRRAMTADEAAEAIGINILSARPRTTELAKLGKIERTGEKRINASGCGAWVWKAKK